MIVEATAPRRENVRNTFWFSQKLSMTGSEGEAYDSIERKSRTTAAGGTAEKSRTHGAITPKRRRIARKKSQPRVVTLTRKKRMCWDFCTTSGGHLA